MVTMWEEKKFFKISNCFKAVNASIRCRPLYTFDDSVSLILAFLNHWCETKRIDLLVI